MLETKSLCKVYKPKRGVPVQALDNVSLKFPDKGMVFLLGKSGSGKSTLLNLLGGLDKYTSGEIIIKGVSSKNFKQSYFDSYRNTYVGFIFQEYNILEEFSVGANIALAIELQGRKASDDEINSILKEVDLEGYGNRKPNELSGGQKQRVAIARALIKNPEIIMADEPTGALDSNTGKQVFDTLKKLSKNKLVIIVSHDREFSEKYADRIIELSDGKVVSDVELAGEGEIIPETDTFEGINFNGSTVEIQRGYHLTEEDRVAINEYIDKIASGEISLDIKTKDSLSSRFKNTDQSKIKSEDGSNFKLIKSKLPFKNAFKIGASGLRYKKVKLVFTVILSVVAFVLFGLADTFASYNHVKASVNSIVDTGVSYVSLKKSVKTGEEPFTYWDDWGKRITKEEIEKISEETGIIYTGIVRPEYMDFYFMGNFDTEKISTETGMPIYAEEFSGIAEINEELLESMGYEILEGKLPDGSKNEIAVSKYVYETFKIGGYCMYEDLSEMIDYREIKDYDDLVGRSITVGGNKEYKITAIIDTKMDLERYLPLADNDEGASAADELVDYVLYSEFTYVKNYSLASAMMVGEGFLDDIVAEMPPAVYISGYFNLYNDSMDVGSDYLIDFDELNKDKVDIIWIDGEKTSLGEKEVIVSSNIIYMYEGELPFDKETGKKDYSILKNTMFECYCYCEDGDYIEGDGWKIVGVIDAEMDYENFDEDIYKWQNLAVVSSERMDEIAGTAEFGEYNYVVGAMPESRGDITDLVKYCNRENVDVRYEMQNAAIYELDVINEALKMLSKVFLTIGIGFAIFASLLLANFIANSISYKKQEIGILRAIGSRSNDVFAIFFSESLIIAVTNFTISSIGVGIITAIINGAMRKGGILVTVLHFGIRQIALLLIISIAIAAIASFIPVKKIASKKPIDAIRNR